MPTEIKLDGKTYRNIGGSWFNAETFIKAPTAVVHRLELRQPSRRKKRKSTTGKSTPRTKPTPSMGRAFTGLQPGDFKQNVTGTTWRRRSELAGLLARQLYDATGLPFLSHVIYRKPAVYLAVPDRIDASDKFPAAKFDIRLDEKAVYYGFLVEKRDGPMDHAWDWQRLLPALQNDGDVQRAIITAMRSHKLAWEAEMWQQDKVAREVAISPAEDGKLVWQEGEEESTLTWPETAAKLRDIPPEWWCNLTWRETMPRETAVAAGVNVARPIVTLYRALLPLYEACTTQK